MKIVNFIKGLDIDKLRKKIIYDKYNENNNDNNNNNNGGGGGDTPSSQGPLVIVYTYSNYKQDKDIVDIGSMSFEITPMQEGDVTAPITKEAFELIQNNVTNINFSIKTLTDSGFGINLDGANMTKNYYDQWNAGQASKRREFNVQFTTNAKVIYTFRFYQDVDGYYIKTNVDPSNMYD